MPIQDSQFRAFTKENVDRAPNVPGVYALYDASACIYIGKAEHSIRVRLQRHLSGAEGRCTQRGTTRYKRERHNNPSARERQLLTEFVQQFGRLPRCNDVMP